MTDKFPSGGTAASSVTCASHAEIQVTESPGDEITGPRAPNARHQAPGSDRRQAPGTGHKAPGTGHQAPAAGHWAPDADHLVSQAHRAPDTGHQAPGSDRRQALGSRHQAPSSRYQAPGTGYWEPGFDWSDDPLDTGHLAPETRYQAPGTDSEHDVKSDSEEPEVPQTLTDNLSAIQLLLPDQIPISIRPPGTRRIRSLVQGDEEQSESNNLPMPGATAAALAARLDSSAASFLAFKKSLYDFAAVEGDPEPVALVRVPVKDAGADNFWRAGHRPAPALSLPMKDVREMWAHSRQRLAVSSVQDWGLAALQSAAKRAQLNSCRLSWRPSSNRSPFWGGPGWTACLRTAF